MSTILHIDASVAAEASASRAASAQLVADMKPGRVIRRDAIAEPLTFVDDAWAKARMVPADELSDPDRATLALSDTLVPELEPAATIVPGTPAYHFGMPASLKAWVDLVARPKRTFQYGPQGPEGLLKGKKAIIVVASGGTKIGSPSDFASTHLTFVLGFLGITDVTVLNAADVIGKNAA